MAFVSEHVASVWTRRVFPSNYFDIERHPSAGPAGGGGALYIDIPASVIPALHEFLGHNPADPPTDEIVTPVSAVGASDVSADLRWAAKSGDRRRLFQNRQSGPDVRHPAWRRERGFPTAADNVSSKDEAAAYIAEGLRIYVVRTTGNAYYAGFLLGGYPDDWPADEELVQLLTGDGGVSEFPAGLLLDPDNQTRPFSTEDESIASETRVLDPGENADPDLPGTAPEESTVSRTAYASTELAAKVDAIAMSLGLRYAQERFPGADVRRMPHNNPGYDILVTSEGAIIRYIEIKGTTLELPRFFLSETERAFSARNAEIYSIVVFHSMDTHAETAEQFIHDGEVPLACLQVVQWRGELGGAED